MRSELIPTDRNNEEKYPHGADAGGTMLIGYARVSTRKQRFDLQLKALEAARCDMVVSEQISGGAGIGRGLLAAIGSCRRGDTLVVWKLDRVSRNLRELLAILDVLVSRGIALKVLTGAGSAIDLTQIEGPAVYTVYAAFAELEREMNKERTIAGLNARIEQSHRCDAARVLVAPEQQDICSRRYRRRSLRCSFNRTGDRRIHRTR
ncbi:recombinase family protein [Corticibacterium sp. UT-5YL-CI-8]|nr:recombinase family protein [Tianweitania sp. UT-5YL-CI-8]